MVNKNILLCALTYCRTSDIINLSLGISVQNDVGVKGGKTSKVIKGGEILEKKETRLTVRVPAEQYKDFKIKCAQNDETITDVIKRFIGEYLEQEKNNSCE